MGLDRAARPATRVPMVLRMRSAGLKADSRRFWIGVAVMAALHAALIAGFVRSAPRYVGEPEGSQERHQRRAGRCGGSCERIHGAFRGTVDRTARQRSASATAAGPARCSAAARAEDGGCAARRGGTVQVRSRHRRRERTARRHRIRRALQRRPPRASPCRRSILSPSLRFDLPDGAFAPGGRSAAVMRPPNVTRSGENDEFGRGVIRALRKTMPVARDTLGRVTVRLLLSETGNLTQAAAGQKLGRPDPGPECGVRRQAVELPDPARRRNPRRPHVPGHLHLPMRRNSPEALRALGKRLVVAVEKAA